MKDLKISIGLPTYNRSRYLIRAIESALNQTYSNLEVIVSDNKSPDDTVEKVLAFSDPRIVFLQQTQNLGMTGNFNACLEAATGDLFLMLSDDDLLEPQCLERLSEPFRSLNPAPEQIGAVWCPVKILNASSEEKYRTAAAPPIEPGWALVEGLLRGTHGPRFCSMMVRRQDAVAAGGYRLEHGPICDFGNWSEIAVSYPFAVCIAEPLSAYTVHQASTTSQPEGFKWQRSGERIITELVALLEQRGEHDTAGRIKSAGNDFISNILATVMMQYMGKPGWVKYWVSEAARAPKYLFASVVFKRLFKDGWKLLRLRSG